MKAPPLFLGSVCCFCCLMLALSPAFAQETESDYSSMVIVKVPDLTGEQYQSLSSALAQDSQYSLEYTCLESGIIVLKFYHHFTEEGDVRMAVNSTLARHGRLKNLEFVYIDIQQGTTARC